MSPPMASNGQGPPLHYFFWIWQFSTVSMDILKTDKNWENIFFSSSIIYENWVCTNGQKVILLSSHMKSLNMGGSLKFQVAKQRMFSQVSLYFLLLRRKSGSSWKVNFTNIDFLLFSAEKNVQEDLAAVGKLISPFIDFLFFSAEYN